MANSIRLKRVGAKKEASFRIVVLDSREGTAGEAVERLGIYNPRTQPSSIRLDAARALYWLHEGATPSDTVRALFRKTGVWQQFHDGVTPDAIEESVVFVGPAVGQRGTSQRPDPVDRAARPASAPAAAPAAETAAAAPAAEEVAETAEASVDPSADATIEEAAEEVEEAAEAAAEDLRENAVDVEEDVEKAVDEAEAAVAEATDAADEDAGDAVEASAEAAEEVDEAAEEVAGDEAEKDSEKE